MTAVSCTVMDMRISYITNISIRSIFRIIDPLLHSNFWKTRRPPETDFIVYIHKRSCTFLTD